MGDGPPVSRSQALIEADIRDVQRQLAEGELDAATARRLIERYRQELDSMEAGTEDEVPDKALPSRSGRRLTGTLLLIGAVIAVSVTAYLAIRPREGGFVTGNMETQVDLSEVTNDQMEVVIAANPDVPGIAAMRLSLADRYFEAGEFSNALPHYLGALDGDLDPTRRSRALARVGWMTFESGNAGIARSYLDEALATATAARDKSPENDNAWVALAAVQARMGRDTEALESLRRAVEVNPGRKRTLPRDRNFETLHEHPDFRRLVGADDPRASAR